MEYYGIPLGGLYMDWQGDIPYLGNLVKEPILLWWLVAGVQWSIAPDLQHHSKPFHKPTNSISRCDYSCSSAIIRK